MGAIGFVVPFLIILSMIFELGFWFLIIKIFAYVIKQIIRRKNYNEFKSDTIPAKSINGKNNYNDITINDLLEFKRKTSDIYKDNFKDVSKEKLELFNVSNIDDLKEYFFNIFYNFEKALNNLDYQELQYLCTNQLYENYYTGIDLDLQKGYKKIIDNIKKEQIIIYELDSTIAKQIVSTLIEISYINYTVSQEGELIKGSKEPVKEKFIVQFRKDIKSNKISNCPNCGAQVSGSKCNYCDTIFNIKNEFKISSIQRIV